MSALPETKIDQPNTNPSNEQPAQQPQQVTSIDIQAQLQKINDQSQPTNVRSSVHETRTEEIVEALAKLEDQLKICISTQQFVEAEELKNKVKEVRLEVVVRRNKEIEVRQAQELEELAHSQSNEAQAFLDAWEKKIAEFKEEAHTAEKDMLKKHEMDLSILEQDLMNSLPLFVRTSPKILNIKKVIENLAKQKEFVQADQLRGQCEQLEEEEVRKAEEQKEKKVSFILMQLAGKQKMELSGLKKRVSTGYFELIKARETDHQKLLYKFQNARKTLEACHQSELTKFETTYKNYIPGERLQFKQRKRCGSTNARTRNAAPSYLNSSFVEDMGCKLVPVLNARKRSVTPAKKDFHIRGYQSNSSGVKKPSNLIPINPVRFVPNQVEKEKANSSMIKE
jgi:hypothetical protein